MDGARTIVATPVGTLLVWSNGADELLACTLSADDKASWTYRDVPGEQLVGPVRPHEQRAHGRGDDGARVVHADSLRRAGGSCRSPAGSAGVPWPRKGRPQGVPSGTGVPDQAQRGRNGPALQGPGWH